MEFRTIIDIEASDLRINHQSRLMLLGSCFVENIGNLLHENKFDTNINPFGVLYNPASISKVLHRIYGNDIFTEKDLFFHNGLYQSFWHHGVFSSPDKDECLKMINTSLKKASDDLLNAETLLITFGTSYVYKDIQSDEIVANCHKLPASKFHRYRLSVDNIVEEWSSLIEKLKHRNSSLKILFTVSPIRHWKDGAHDNQLSKAILLIAINELHDKYPDIYYFPSYELLLDDLRDYRFYAENMIHPNNIAIQYIWEAFQEAYFNEDTKQIVKEWNNIRQAINHRPFNPQTDEHKQFLRQTLLRLDIFQKKYSYFRIEKERIFLENQLK